MLLERGGVLGSVNQPFSLTMFTNNDSKTHLSLLFHFDLYFVYVHFQLTCCLIILNAVTIYLGALTHSNITTVQILNHQHQFQPWNIMLHPELFFNSLSFNLQPSKSNQVKFNLQSQITFIKSDILASDSNTSNNCFLVSS